jgi:general secretion pathway protein D
LEWLLTDNWEMMMKNNSNPFAPLSSNPRVQMNANSSGGGVTKGLRFWGSDASSGKQVVQGGGTGTAGAIASFASVLTNPDLTLILHALEQNGNADLLSAPKVTTRSGSEATIKVVTEYIYPTAFEVQGGQLNGGANNNGNANAGNLVQETTVVPSDFATREVGVILNVMPEVSPDGNMINLNMKPSVVTDPIWYQYGSQVRRADGSTMQMNMPQPFFQIRTLETQISIYDGATVVMGGLITESVEKANDKIPVLGDIPFLGALFRSKTEKSVKKNLLIFVTAKLVDPAGRLIRSQDAELVKQVGASEGTPQNAPK